MAKKRLNVEKWWSFIFTDLKLFRFWKTFEGSFFDPSGKAGSRKLQCPAQVVKMLLRKLVIRCKSSLYGPVLTARATKNDWFWFDLLSLQIRFHRSNNKQNQRFYRRYNFASRVQVKPTVDKIFQQLSRLFSSNYLLVCLKSLFNFYKQYLKLLL